MFLLAERLLCSGDFPVGDALLGLRGMNVAGVCLFCLLAGTLALLAPRKTTHLIVILAAL